MNLDEFRSALSSDATKENEGLKTELKNAKDRIVRLTSELDQVKARNDKADKDIVILQNRCAAHTRFSLCCFCDMKFRCKALENQAMRVAEQLRKGQKKS